MCGPGVVVTCVRRRRAASDWFAYAPSRFPCSAFGRLVGSGVVEGVGVVVFLVVVGVGAVVNVVCVVIVAGAAAGAQPAEPPPCRKGFVVVGVVCVGVVVGVAVDFFCWW